MVKGIKMGGVRVKTHRNVQFHHISKSFFSDPIDKCCKTCIMMLILQHDKSPYPSIH